MVLEFWALRAEDEISDLCQYRNQVQTNAQIQTVK